MTENLVTRTEIGLGRDLLEIIQKQKICIIGCGGVGTNFAEMLVRTGVLNIGLIDGDKVEITNLNRVFSFYKSDVGKDKVHALSQKLKQINCKSSIDSINYHFKSNSIIDESKNKEIKDLIIKSDIIFIAVDENNSRIEIEDLCKDNKKKYLSVGVGIKPKEELSFYECTWKPQTPENKAENKGYGEGNPSYASIIMEATAVCFQMLLHHLKNPNSKRFRYIYREYKSFNPITSCIKDAC